MSIARKECSQCGAEHPLTAEFWRRDRRSKTGFRSSCKDCQKAKGAPEKEARIAELEAALPADTGEISKEESLESVKRDTQIKEELERRDARHADPFSKLKPEDFDVGALNDGRIDRAASREKRQEYSRAMGETLSEVSEAAGRGADGGQLIDALSDKSIRFLSALSEQEKRFGNRRHSRSFSLAMAHEVMAMRLMRDIADRYFTAKIEPKGWAEALNPPRPAKRTVCLLLSDLHLGADLGLLDEPMPYRAVEEARRLEYVVRQAADYKPQYRDVSELVVMLNGDVIQGMLMHDIRDGIPIVEQKAVFWNYMCEALGYLASAYPRVRVVCQPGNHGRDKLRHPGRATSRKWDGHEWEMYYALSRMASSLKNVTFDIPFRAVSILDLYGSKLLLTHGDTELKIGHPLKAAEKNAAVMDNINSTLRYGCTFDAAAFGHWHYGVYVPATVRLIHNAALIPPDGFIRTIGANYATCGQFLWEAVEGYPVGDVRFIAVNESQDRDERLGEIIHPFRFESDQ